MRKKIYNLDDPKVTQCGDIPAKILRESIDIYLVELTNIINSSFQNGCFLEELKMAEVLTIFKKKDSLHKENYRPLIILSHMPKVFERLMYKQNSSYMNDKLSPLLTGFTERITILNIVCQLCLNKGKLNKGNK